MFVTRYVNSPRRRDLRRLRFSLWRLGIGATTAIFTLVYAVLLKSLPVVNPEDLWRVGNEENCCVNGGMQDNWTLFSYEQYKQFRDQATGFAELAAFQAGQDMIGVRRNGSNKPSEPFQSEYVSGNYFSTFGILPYFGRTITPNDDRKGAPAVAMMSFQDLAGKVWQGPVGGRSGLCDQRPAIHRGRDYSAGILRRSRTEHAACFFHSSQR